MNNVNYNLQSENATQKRGISGFSLKMIAVVTMFIDHFAAVVLLRLLYASYDVRGAMFQSEHIGDKLIIWTFEHQDMLWNVYETMRLIGRMAFPIYCFLLVQGFLYTRNVKKYAFRLFIFSLISEIPFDFSLNQTWWNPTYNNVFFTLLLGLLCIVCLSWIENAHKKWQVQEKDKFIGWVLRIGTSFIVALTTFYLAENVLYTDYGFAGVLAIVLIYLFREQPMIGFILCIMALGEFSSDTEYAALLMLIPLYLYNGTRGKQVKYFFYAFYPIHLFAFGLICMWLGV